MTGWGQRTRISRRRVLQGSGLAAAATLLGGRAALSAPLLATQTIELTAVTAGAGQYLYLPFEVPDGVNRVEVAVTKLGDAATGVGLFDERGAGYQSAGFRGVYGEERSELFVAAHEASQSFVPGPINAGTWTVVIPVFRATTPTQVTATVTLSFGPEQAPFVLGPEQGVVRNDPGWYRGDLHCHTPESSDAWAAQTALSPEGWGATCREIGLDYAAMTDHNVVSQNVALAAAAGESGVLLLPGEEMTNWFHGHATVSGIEPGAWLDWRQRPTGVPLQANEARITEFIGLCREMGAYVSAAHPMFAHLSWQFFPDAEADADARTDGIEVWTGQFQPDDEAALLAWDGMLVRGMRIFANGGSDLHAVDDPTFGFVAGTPTTVVHADALSKPAIVAALHSGRSFVTRVPYGHEVYLTATGADGQRQIMGGTIYGEAGDTADVEALVRVGAEVQPQGSLRLVVWANGSAVSVTPITSDEQVVAASIPVGPAGGYVRAELRDAPFIDPAHPLAGRTDMEAFTNPVFLVNGPVPPGTTPDPTGPPAPAPPPGSTAPAAAGGPARLPATGGGAPVLGLAAAAAGVAAMTLTEVIHRAGQGSTLRGRTLRVCGQLTDRVDHEDHEGPATRDVQRDVEVAVLTRWAPACCAEHERQVEVEIMGADLPPTGTWIEADASWVDGSGEGFMRRPRLAVASVRVLDEPPPRFEA